MIAIVVTSVRHGVTGTGEIGETAGVGVIRHLEGKFVKTYAFKLLTYDPGRHPGIFHLKVAIVTLIIFLIVRLIGKRVFTH